MSDIMFWLAVAGEAAAAYKARNTGCWVSLGRDPVGRLHCRWVWA